MVFTGGVATLLPVPEIDAAFAKLVEMRCGPTATKALQAASEVEIAADPSLALEALAEAKKRDATLTTIQSCDYVISEIQDREKRAAAAALGGDGAAAKRSIMASMAASLSDARKFDFQ